MGAKKLGATITPTQFTPSEQVFLHGEQFAEKAHTLDTVELLTPGVSVSAYDLGAAILFAALLSCEQAGAIHLEIRTGKVLLIKHNHVYVVSASSSNDWLPHSLEAQICSLVQTAPMKVSDIIYKLLDDTSNIPWELVATVVKEGLAARGVLEIQLRRHLFLTSINFHLAEHIEIPPAVEELGHINDLFTRCRQIHPELWRLLHEELKIGVSRHYPEPDMALDQ